MALHLNDGIIAHSASSFMKCTLMIALSPVFLLLALFYMILHADRAECYVPAGTAETRGPV
jgi:hypothetical protein